MAAFLFTATQLARRRPRFLAGILWLALTASTATAEQGVSAEEYKLKAAFIYNFTQFIDWPDTAFPRTDAAFTLCVIDRDPFGSALRPLEKRRYKTHPIVVTYPKTAAETRSCNILYVDDPLNMKLGSDLGQVLGDAPVLTISSDESAMDAGIGIGFVNQAGKLRWKLNLDVMRKAQLKVSAKLIEIAVIVINEKNVRN